MVAVTVPAQLSVAVGVVTVAEHSPVIVGKVTTVGTGAVTSSITTATSFDVAEQGPVAVATTV